MWLMTAARWNAFFAIAGFSIFIGEPMTPALGIATLPSQPCQSVAQLPGNHIVLWRRVCPCLSARPLITWHLLFYPSKLFTPEHNHQQLLITLADHCDAAFIH